MPITPRPDSTGTARIDFTVSFRPMRSSFSHALIRKIWKTKLNSRTVLSRGADSHLWWLDVWCRYRKHSVITGDLRRKRSFKRSGRSSANMIVYSAGDLEGSSNVLTSRRTIVGLQSSEDS